MGIYELMTMTSQIREMTFKGESTQVIRKVARKQGMRTLFEDGMIKAMKGQTTLDEVLRITQHEIAGRAATADDREVPRRAGAGRGDRRGVAGASPASARSGRPSARPVPSTRRSRAVAGIGRNRAPLA